MHAVLFAALFLMPATQEKSMSAYAKLADRLVAASNAWDVALWSGQNDGLSGAKLKTRMKAFEAAASEMKRIDFGAFYKVLEVERLAHDKKVLADIETRLRGYAPSLISAVKPFLTTSRRAPEGQKRLRSLLQEVSEARKTIVELDIYLGMTDWYKDSDFARLSSPATSYWYDYGQKLAEIFPDTTRADKAVIAGSITPRWKKGDVIHAIATSGASTRVQTWSDVQKVLSKVPEGADVTVSFTRAGKPRSQGATVSQYHYTEAMLD